MADVDIICRECGKTVTVSEFADISAMVCRCGTRFAAQKKAEAPKPAATARLKKNQELPIATSSGQLSMRKSDEIVQAKTTRKNLRQTVISTHFLGSCLIFLVLGAVMGMLRYGGSLDKNGLALMKQIAPYMAIGLHVLIVLKAFKDSVFVGILCLLVPFYSIYYLFSVSDDFYLRAVVAGLMVGFGEDSAEFFQAMAQIVIKKVNNYILSGG